METLIQITEAVPNPSRRWMGQTLLIIVSSAEDMQTVLNSPHCLQKSFLYDYMDLDVNVGLFLAKGNFNEIIHELASNNNQSQHIFGNQPGNFLIQHLITKFCHRSYLFSMKEQKLWSKLWKLWWIRKNNSTLVNHFFHAHWKWSVVSVHKCQNC